MENRADWMQDRAPSWALLGTLMMAAVALAGCIGAMGATSTGMTMEDPAEERAQAWDEGASLVGVYAAEGAHDASSSGPYGSPPPGSAHADAFNASWGEVGDGQAPAWAYAYEAGDRGLVIVVDGNGTVIDEEETDAFNQTPIQGWNVDSMDAIAVLEDHDDTWAQANPDMAMYGLMQEDPSEDPVWFMAIMTQHGTSGFGMVNATTGAYIHSNTFDMHGGWGSWEGADWEGNHSWGGSGSWDWDDEDHVPTEQGSFEGTLTALEPEHEHTFDIRHDGHGTLGLTLKLDRSVWTAVTATVRGPGTHEITLEADTGEDEDHATIANPPLGTYTITVAFDQGPLVLEEGAMQEYEVEWCAPGTDLAYRGDWSEDWRGNEAC